MSRAPWPTALSGFILLLATCSEASAAYVGDYFFPSTLATTVPTAADFFNPPYLVRLPETGTTLEIDVPATYSKLITKDWAVIVTDTYRILEQTTGTRAGFGNLVLGTQYQLYTDA